MRFRSAAPFRFFFRTLLLLHATAKICLLFLLPASLVGCVCAHLCYAVPNGTVRLEKPFGQRPWKQEREKKEDHQPSHWLVPFPRAQSAMGNYRNENGRTKTIQEMAKHQTITLQTRANRVGWHRNDRNLNYFRDNRQGTHTQTFPHPRAADKPATPGKGVHTNERKVIPRSTHVNGNAATEHFFPCGRSSTDDGGYTDSENYLFLQPSSNTQGSFFFTPPLYRTHAASGMAFLGLGHGTRCGTETLHPTQMRMALKLQLQP